MMGGWGGCSWWSGDGGQDDITIQHTYKAHENQINTD